MARKGVAHDRKQRSWAFGMVLTIPLILASQLGWAEKLAVDCKRVVPAQRSILSTQPFSGPGKPLEALVNSATNKPPASFQGIDSVNSGAPLQDSIPQALDSVETPDQDTIGKLDMTDTIEAVWVKAYRPISKMDATKQIFKFNSTGLSPTATALEALRFTPGVARIGEQFQLLGHEKNAEIRIDGIKSNQSQLKALTASMIDRIEVIPLTVDNDKYGGAINIVLKRVNKTKHWGRIPILYQFNSKSLATTPSYILRNKKMDLFIYAEYMHTMKKHSELDYLPGGLWTDGANSIINNSKNSDRYTTIAKYNLNIRPNLLLSLNYTIQAFTSSSDITYKEYGAESMEYNGLWGSTVSQFANANLRYMALPWMHIILRGHITDNLTKGELIHNTHRDERMRIAAGELEILHPKLKTWAITHTLQEGYRINARDITMGREVGKTYIHRFFLTDAINITSWLSLYAMLKIDWDSYQVKGFTSRNIVPLPAVMLSSPSRLGNLQLRYERAAGRPSPMYLVPETIATFNGMKITGNPYLNNQTSDKYTLSYGKQIMGQYLSLFGSYSQTENIIDATYTSPTEQTYENVGRGNVARIGAGLSLSFFDYSLRINLNGAAEYQNFLIKEEFLNSTISIGNKGWGGYASASLNYEDPWKISWRLDAFYRPRTIFLNQIKNVKSPTLFFSVERNFLKNMLSVRLQYNNMFGLGERWSDDFTFRTGSYKQTTYFQMHDLTLSVCLNLGKPIQTRNYGPSIENDDLISEEK